MSPSTSITFFPLYFKSIFSSPTATILFPFIATTPFSMISFLLFIVNTVAFFIRISTFSPKTVIPSPKLKNRKISILFIKNHPFILFLKFTLIKSTSSMTADSVKLPIYLLQVYHIFL